MVDGFLSRLTSFLAGVLVFFFCGFWFISFFFGGGGVLAACPSQKKVSCPGASAKISVAF